MKPNEVVTMYVAFADNKGGKRRPILVVADKENTLEFYGITSQYENKSEAIKALYSPISEWKEIGLKKQSWIDVGTLRAINKGNKKLRFKSVGVLSSTDRKTLIKYLEKKKR